MRGFYVLLSFLFGVFFFLFFYDELVEVVAESFCTFLTGFSGCAKRHCGTGPCLSVDVELGAAGSVTSVYLEHRKPARSVKF